METLELNKDDSERIVRDYQQKVSSYLGKLIESGQAPWNRQVNGLQDLPYDPSAGKPHRGINRLLLMAKEDERGYEYAPGKKDTRWLTADAAEKAYGAVLKSGEQSGIKVLTLNKLDDDKYRAQTRVLYNAQQFKNFPPMQDMSKAAKPVLSRAEELYAKVGIESRESSEPLPTKQLYSWATQKMDAPQAVPVGSKEYHQTNVGREIFGTLASAEYGVPSLRDTSEKNSQMVEAIKRHPDLLFKACLQAENSLDRLIELRPGMSAGLTSSVADLKEPNPYLHQKPVPIQKNEVQSLKKETEAKVDPIEERVRAEYPVKQYLAVTKDEREEAKKLGAQWDGRGWYANPKAEPRPEILKHSKFTDITIHRSQSEIKGSLEDFRSRMQRAGIIVEGELIADGSKHWASVEGSKGLQDKKANYWIKTEGGVSYGSAKNFKTAEVVKFKLDLDHDRRNLHPKDLAKLDAINAKMMQERDIQKVISEEKKLDLAQRTHRLLKISHAAPDNHPYLAEKGVKAHGVYAKDDKLIIPMHDVQGKIWSYQRIEAEKSSDPKVPRKKFAYGTQPNGLMFVVGGTVKDVFKSGEVMIAEGFATAASVHEATRKPVAVAFSGDNLSHVAEAFRAKHKDMNIVILGEHDIKNLSDDRKKQMQSLANNPNRLNSIESPAMLKADDIKKMKLDSLELGALRDLNPGRFYAFAAAQKSGGTAIFPKFEKEHSVPGGPSDFNDLHKLKGLGEVKKQVGEALSLAKGPEVEQPRKERSVKQELGMSMG